MRRGLLLNRDGVINVSRGYVGSRASFEFMPGLFPFLKATQDHGFRLAILTNQSGVARGFYTEDDFTTLTAWMLDEFQQQGITIDLVLGCYEHAEGYIPTYTRESYWRKPNPGMMLEAVQRLRLDPARSFFLGDKMRDMDAAAAGGIQHRVLLSQSATPSEGVVVVRNFDEALTRVV